MYKYAGVVVNNDSVQLDRIFTYKIPEALMNKIDIGYRVKVPFGKGNKFIDGFVMELYEELENNIVLKDIKELCDELPLLKKSDIKLIKNMKSKYLCTYLECIKVIIPSGITKGVKNKVTQVLILGSELNEKYNKEPYETIYDLVIKNEGLYNKTEFSKNFNISLSSINTMIKHGFLKLEEKIVNRYNEREYNVYGAKVLNEEQNKAVNTILYSDKTRFLLHGITGSGKTEIYMNLVSHMLTEKKESIILIPEISLTPQMVERFKGRFGKEIAVFHSKLSDGERFDEWMRVKNGNVKVAIGARSAVFLPFNNLGIIIIDEEHEGSYKSDSDPKYNAREIAHMKCELEGCKLVLGSATPSVETYYDAMRDEIELITIKNRADGAELPKVEIVDMREELLSNNKSIFSRALHEGITEALSKKEQIILFLNRRGFSTFVSCRQCGYVFKCSKCDIALTYHSYGDYLVCHYCGEKQQVQKICPKCGSKYVKYFGTGTEKIQEEVKRIFPSARTIRMDFDTTRKKDSYENIYEHFKNKKADILIGTQMVAKGLDFKDVTLVGVIAADLSLNLPDFRASEKTFQLVTQVSGRAGRGKKEGKVIIQTYNPENISIKSSAQNDYDSFYKEEIILRMQMQYPPFSKIMSINLSGEDENILIKCIQNVGINLKNTLSCYDKIIVLGPCPCGISKIKNQFRWQIIIKGEIDEGIGAQIKDVVYKITKSNSSSIRVGIDVNPTTLI